MEQEAFIFLASLAAVTALVAITHFLGFSRRATIEDEDEVREVLALVPGGFETDAILIDDKGEIALARERNGRLAVVSVHGNKLVARTLGADATVQAVGNKLHVTASDLGARSLVLCTDADQAQWATRGPSAT